MAEKLAPPASPTIGLTEERLLSVIRMVRARGWRMRLASTMPDGAWSLEISDATGAMRATRRGDLDIVAHQVLTDLEARRR